MKVTHFITMLREYFSVDEFFFILAYLVGEDIEKIELEYMFKFIPQWKKLMVERQKELARHGVKYESELDESDLLL
jgi:hypothetical protein